MMPHLFPLLLRIAIPSFLIGSLLSMVLPLITGTLQSAVGGWLAKITAWQEHVSPLVGDAVNICFALIFGTLLVKAGVGVSDATLSCLKDPATKIAASCIDAKTIGDAITYLVTVLSAVLGGKSIQAHAAWKAATTHERAAGAGRGQ